MLTASQIQIYPGTYLTGVRKAMYNSVRRFSVFFRIQTAHFPKETEVLPPEPVCWL